MSDKDELSGADALKILDDLNLTPDTWRYYGHRTKTERLAIGIYLLSLRVKGKTFRTIEEETGVPRTTVQRYADKALASIQAPTVEQARAMEVERLEALIEAWYPSALAGDKDAGLMYMKLSTRLGEITGTNKPIEISSTVTEITAEEQELQQMIAQAERDSAVQESKLNEDAQ